MQEEEAFHVHWPNAYCKVVREGMEREGQEMARHGHRKVIKVVRSGEGVDHDGLHRCLAEDEGV